MKKLIVILTVVCLVFAGVIGCITYMEQPADAEPSAEPVTEPEESEEISAEESAAPIKVLTLDYEALYASHEPEEVVARVNGKDVLWDEYFYWLCSNISEAENYISTMANYGIEVNWDDPWSQESDQSYAEYVVWVSEESIKEIMAIEDFAAENNIQLGEDILAEMEEQIQSTIASVCGEDATEEDFAEYLSQIHLSRELFDRMTRINYLYQQGYIQLYGENGELASDDMAMRYLTDNAYVSANHILLRTVDSSTGEALDEETAAEKKAEAEALAKELQAITDPEQLLARFAELKEEYCEDTGKVYYPDGYTFTPGTMVAEFEDACNALADYQVSDPVETSYGYHIILRLPLDPDRIVEYSNYGTPLTGRSMAANAEYGSRIDAQIEKTEYQSAADFAINISDYLK